MTASDRSPGINIRDKFFAPSRIAFPGRVIKRLRRRAGIDVAMETRPETLDVSSSDVAIRGVSVIPVP